MSSALDTWNTRFHNPPNKLPYTVIMANEGALATLDDDAAINEIANGAILQQIADRYGCSKIAVWKRLRKHPDYPDAISLQAHAFVQDALKQVMECDADTVNIARARVDAAFKYARAHNRDYADKQQIDVSSTITVEHVVKTNLDSLVSRNVLTIENEPDTTNSIDAVHLLDNQPDDDGESS